MLEDFCEICEGSEDKEGPGSLLGVGTEGEGEVESLVTVAILSDEEATATAADVHRMMTRKVRCIKVVGYQGVLVSRRLRSQDNLGVVQAGSGRCGGCWLCSHD